MKILCLYLALLFFLLVGAVNLPFVHNSITKKANNIFHEKGLPLHISKITLLISGKIGIEQAGIITENSDTILYAGNIKIAIRPLPLLFKRVVINELTLNNCVVNLLTDSITGKLALLSFLPVRDKSADTPKKEGKAWDIEGKAVHLNNIRFLYSSAKNGISIKQNLYKADFLFNNFSLLQKIISVDYLRLEKADGEISSHENCKKQK